MIDRFAVRNYKGLRHVELQLTPIHVLIGPNDSGKSSILEALEALSRSVDFPLAQSFPGRWLGEDLCWQRKVENQIELEATLNGDGEAMKYACVLSTLKGERQLHREGETYVLSGERQDVAPAWRPSETAVHCYMRGQRPQGHESHGSFLQRIHEKLSGVQSYRWDSRFLSLPAASDSKKRFRMDRNGFGLARCLDDILGYDRRIFDTLENQFIRIFPHFKAIRLLPEPAYSSQPDPTNDVPLLQPREGKGLRFETDADVMLPAPQVSDGVLLVLAYLTVLYLPEPPRLLLVEEPENGIHPHRLTEVMGILKQLVEGQTHTQIVLTTHSPHMRDEFEPEEVTLCQRRPNGSIATTRLSDSPSVKRQLDVFTLGENWSAEGDEALAPQSTEVAGGE